MNDMLLKQPHRLPLINLHNFFIYHSPKNTDNHEIENNTRGIKKVMLPYTRDILIETWVVDCLDC